MRVNGDPASTFGPSVSARKSARDGKTWTGTEAHKRDIMMRQFMQLDGPKGASKEYKASDIWCRCERRMKAEAVNLCQRCASVAGFGYL